MQFSSNVTRSNIKKSEHSISIINPFIALVQPEESEETTRRSNSRPSSNCFTVNDPGRKQGQSSGGASPLFTLRNHLPWFNRISVTNKYTVQLFSIYFTTKYRALWKLVQIYRYIYIEREIYCIFQWLRVTNSLDQISLHVWKGGVAPRHRRCFLFKCAARPPLPYPSRPLQYVWTQVVHDTQSSAV